MTNTRFYGALSAALRPDGGLDPSSTPLGTVKHHLAPTAAQQSRLDTRALGMARPWQQKASNEDAAASRFSHDFELRSPRSFVSSDVNTWVRVLV